MRFILLVGAAALTAACGGNDNGVSTEVPPPTPPPALSVNLTGPSNVADSAKFSLTTNGSSSTQFTVKMEDGSVAYQGGDSTFMWHPASSISGAHTLTPSATDAGRNASGTALAVTVSHPIPIRFARSRMSPVIREQCGNNTWVMDKSKLTLGLFLSTTDSTAGTQTCQELGDSSYAGQFYSVSTPVYTFHEDEVIKFTASLSGDGVCWNLSDAQFILQRSDSATPGIMKQTAVFSWDQLKQASGTLTVPIGQVGTSSGYIINPIVVFKHKCGNVDDSKVLISGLKIVYTPVVPVSKVDSAKTFAPDSITITSSRR